MIELKLSPGERAALRESVELESTADLHAAARNLGAAVPLLKQSNKIRERIFGKFDPNELRARTHEALEQ